MQQGSCNPDTVGLGGCIRSLFPSRAREEAVWFRMRKPLPYPDGDRDGSVCRNTFQTPSETRPCADCSGFAAYVKLAPAKGLGRQEKVRRGRTLRSPVGSDVRTAGFIVPVQNGPQSAPHRAADQSNVKAFTGGAKPRPTATPGWTGASLPAFAARPALANPRTSPPEGIVRRTGRRGRARRCSPERTRHVRSP